MNKFIKKIAEEAKPDTPVNNSEGRTKGIWEYFHNKTLNKFVVQSDKNIPVCIISQFASSFPCNDEGVTEAEANAAFIVKAVNSHDMLVEALQRLLTSHYRINNESVFSDEIERFAEDVLMKAK